MILSVTRRKDLPAIVNKAAEINLHTVTNLLALCVQMDPKKNPTPNPMTRVAMGLTPMW